MMSTAVAEMTWTPSRPAHAPSPYEDRRWPVPQPGLGYAAAQAAEAIRALRRTARDWLVLAQSKRAAPALDALVEFSVMTKAIEELTPFARDVLGHDGVERLEKFKTFRAGWDAGAGTALSAASIGVCESFLRAYPRLSRHEPSLFLTGRGNLQLAWEDDAGEHVEVEFLPDRVEYYLGAQNEEGVVGLDDLSSLLGKLT